LRAIWEVSLSCREFALAERVSVKLPETMVIFKNKKTTTSHQKEVRLFFILQIPTKHPIFAL
jgi:hypothetical protein